VIVLKAVLCDFRGACCAGWASLTHTITPFAYFPPNSQPPPSFDKWGQASFYRGDKKSSLSPLC
jgi:hypothetical protein